MNLKAYVWDDEYNDKSHIVWATTPGKAKALLAAEHDEKFTELRVKRLPWADQYKDFNKIPAAEFFKHGWWMYCLNCGKVVRNGTATVLDEVEVLCDECAKDWSEEK